MKRIFCLALSLCCAVAFAQKSPQEVSLVVSADGATKTEAVNNALRMAIEQTYGTFVSANTEILNDQLVKDEIATVSSGNIQKYTEVAVVTLPNGNNSVTLDVTVSLSKLVSYAKSKGSECEFAGATFGANMRLYEFYKKNEQIAIENLIRQLSELRPVYDYEIKVSEPTISRDRKTANIELDITVISNNKTEIFNSLISKTVSALAMTEKQVEPMIKAGFEYYGYYLCLDGEIGNFKTNQYGTYFKKLYPLYFFYNSATLEMLDKIMNILIWDLTICDNDGHSLSKYASFSSHYDRYVTSKDYSLGHKAIVGQGQKFEWANDYRFVTPTFKAKIPRAPISDSYYYKHPETGHYYWDPQIFALNTARIVMKLPKITLNIPTEELTTISKIVVVPSLLNIPIEELATRGEINVTLLLNDATGALTFINRLKR